MFTRSRNGSSRNPAAVSQGLNHLLHQVVGYLDELIGLLRRSPAATNQAALQVVTEAVAASPGLGRLERPPRRLEGSGAEGLIRVPTARFDELTDLAGELIVEGRFWLSQAESIRTFAATLRACRNRLLASMERLHEVGPGREGRTLRTHVEPSGGLAR